MNQILTNKPKAYNEAVINFLNDLEGEKVKSLVMVALCDDEETHDVVCTWKAGPIETMTVAGVLQLHAGLMYNNINSEVDDDEDYD